MASSPICPDFLAVRGRTSFVPTILRTEMHDSYSSSREKVTLWPESVNSRVEPISWAWLAGLVAIAAVLRVVALNQQLWFDEIVTLLDSARDPMLRIVTHYGGQNQHMLYSVLAHCSIRVFGEQPWVLRLPAVLFGVAGIPALYFFGSLVASKREALFAAGLMVINYQHIWFSQNARGYTGMVFWTLLASIFFVRCANNGRKSDCVMYGISAALGIYTHLTMAFVVVGHALLYAWLIWSRTKSAGRMPKNVLLPLYGLMLAATVSFALYAPVIPGIFARTIGVAGTSVRSEWASPLWALKEMVHGLRNGAGGGLVAIVVGGLLLLTGSVSFWRSNRFVVGLMVLPGLVTAAAVLATSHNFWPRFFFFEIGFALLLLVRGAVVCSDFAAILVGGTSRLAFRLSTAVLVLMLLASVIPLRAEYRYPKQDYVSAMRFVEGQQRSEEQVVTVGVVTTAFQRYYGRSWPLLETRAQLDAQLTQDRGTWLIYAMPIYIRASQPDVWDAIQSRFTLVRVFPGTLSGGEIFVCRSKDERTQAVLRDQN
jgi:mannosyltransferase